MADDTNITNTDTQVRAGAELVTPHGNARTMFHTPRARDHRILTCYCCRETYLRGYFKCCAPPNGMSAHKWREQFCMTCRKCPNHCACEKPMPEQKPPASSVAEMAASIPRTQGAFKKYVETVSQQPKRPEPVERNWYETEREL